MKTVLRRGVVVAIGSVLRDMVDHDRNAGLVDFMANRRFDSQLAPRPQTERDLIPHFASDPAVLGDPGDGRKSHARRSANDLKDRRDGINGADRGNVGGKFGHVYPVARVATVTQVRPTPLLAMVGCRVHQSHVSSGFTFPLHSRADFPRAGQVLR